MPIVPLRLTPTVNAEVTETMNEAGISSCNLIRFKSKLPQKLGGWEKFYPDNLGQGVRDLHPWQDLSANDWLAIAATNSVTAISNGTSYDISPQVKTTDFSPNFTTGAGSSTVTILDAGIANVTNYDSVLFNTPIAVGGIVLNGAYAITASITSDSYQIEIPSPATAGVINGGIVPSFTTISGSPVVTVTLALHGLTELDLYTFLIPTTVGGVTISGTYPILSVPSVNSFTISANNTASSSTSADMNGGLAQIQYFLALGPVGAGSGYGTGTYGTGGYGTGVASAAQSGTPLVATDWSQDNWGEILLASPEDGAIFQWQPNSGFQNLKLINEAPIFNRGIFVAMPAQILVAWGSVSSGQQQDPLIVNWSNSEDFTVWTPTASNQAGQYRIPTGSKIVGGMQAPQQALLWTDIEVWAMVYQGPPYVFGFNKIGAGCGLIGKHAAAVLRGTVFWMSPGNFFVMGSSGVQVLPCSVWDVVFQDINTDYQHKCVAAPNSTFDEMWFFYPSMSGNATECDKYVKINLSESPPSWDYGTMQRSAWIDQSVLGQPIGATSSGTIFQHETSPNADGQAMNSWFETGYFVIAEAQDMVFMDWFFPDFKWAEYPGTSGATILCTITAVDYPNSTERVYGPFTLTAAKTFINCRLRGRQIKIKFESQDIDSWWRLGLMRYRANKDGRR
jgi:hypothetical protein